MTKLRQNVNDSKVGQAVNSTNIGIKVEKLSHNLRSQSSRAVLAITPTPSRPRYSGIGALLLFDSVKDVVHLATHPWQIVTRPLEYIGESLSDFLEPATAYDGTTTYSTTSMFLVKEKDGLYRPQ